MSGLLLVFGAPVVHRKVSAGGYDCRNHSRESFPGLLVGTIHNRVAEGVKVLPCRAMS